MRWIETAHVSVLLAACSSKARPRVACRRTAALSWLLSPHARYGDSLHIHPFPPPAKKEWAKVSDVAYGHQPQLVRLAPYTFNLGRST